MIRTWRCQSDGLSLWIFYYSMVPSLHWRTTYQFLWTRNQGLWSRIRRIIVFRSWPWLHRCFGVKIRLNHKKNKKNGGITFQPVSLSICLHDRGHLFAWWCIVFISSNVKLWPCCAAFHHHVIHVQLHDITCGVMNTQPRMWYYFCAMLSRPVRI